ncbi:Zn-dependent hydrolase [candidate division KSB1 bacterium]|nr:Zn-dependent hydrolase [candidate division KSB1 bacterium]
MRKFSIFFWWAALAVVLFVNTHVFAQTTHHDAINLRVNVKRLEQRILALAEFGKNPFGGVSRVAFSEADIQGRNYVISLMREAGLKVKIDAAGNIIGRREGRDPKLPSIIFGSHIDSVPNGGNYDGDVGSIGAIECAQVLHENNLATHHPLEVVVFADEEGGLVGSRAMIGELTAEALAVKSHSGKTIREGIRAIGGDPDKLAEAVRRKGDCKIFLELHIEQGGILVSEHLNIGVVEGIVGIKWWDVTIEGFANHAGTTPMDKRQDALLAAAQLIIAVNKVVTSVPGRQVGTVGRITAEPGAPNVIPGKVIMSLELRDLSSEKVNSLFQTIQEEAKNISQKTGTKISFSSIPTNSIPALTDECVRKIIAESARDLGLSFKLMPSGAGHDAQDMARIAPAGMIFVPSAGGISHSPKEYTKPEDMANGANVLLQTILKIDQGALE